jgi:tetratricopeptide (TPR) repeat protein
MRRSHLLNSLVAVIVLLFASLVASAQVGQLRGSVKLMGGDGNAAPVANAVVDVWRTDIGGEYHTKSDKKGEWVFAGLPYTGIYVVSVSAPGAMPTARKDVRAGREIPVDIVLSPGDGKKLSRDEAVAAAGSGVGPAKSGGGDEAEKAKAAEIAKENERIMNANKKVEDSNKVISEAFKAGNTALMAKNYDEAIKQYDAGIAVDPDHPGVPSLLTNKSAALRSRGVDKYNAAITSKDDAARTAGMDAAKADFSASADAANRAVELLKKQPAPTDPEAQKQAATNKYYALSARAEAMRFYLTKVDPTKADQAIAAYQEFMAAETDVTKKSKEQLDFAQLLFDANAYDQAKAEYEKILAESPDNPDALANMGLIYFNAGAAKETEGKKDEAKPLYQQAANYLQKFIDKAPEGHKFKADAKAVLDEMKNQQNVQAEKTSNPPKRGTGKRP